MISTLLIANRGEIAVRIARTAHGMGIRTVAVFTTPDRGALHAEVADVAVHIDDYLNAEGIIEAAQRIGADAIHPGFGFLAENAEFATAVSSGGLIWVGPPPDAISSMGSKAGARAMMASAGVPVLPGYDGDNQSDAFLLAEATKIGWPVIIKASAGGGGKGMQVVESEDNFIPSLQEARRLAQSAFGDDRMVLEKYLSVARHIEVQVMADTHGNCVHLWERECSIQRRHQKVIEEAPSPAFLGPGGQSKREVLCDHAVQAARAVDYVGAGTVEFVVDGEGEAYFLEMNTRIQVEHPVTECVTGVDIVELQLRVASGEVLPLTQTDVECDGWAMEARIYAEDPDNGYLPSTGTIHAWLSPCGDGVRVDSGVRSGSEVTVHYDPMLAKVIAHAANRELAVRRLAGSLNDLVVLGVTTNRDHLGRVLRHPEYAKGNLHTRFLDVHANELLPKQGGISEALVAAVVHDWCERPAPRLPGIRKNWRNSPWRPVRYDLMYGGEERVVELHDCDGQLWIDGQSVRVHEHGFPMRLEVQGVVRSAFVVRVGDTSYVRLDAGEYTVIHRPRFEAPGADEADGGCIASMPGKVVQVLVSEGESVEKGQAVVVLEAMKMEQTMTAPDDGVVSAVNVAVDDQVDVGAVLVVVDPIADE